MPISVAHQALLNALNPGYQAQALQAPPPTPGQPDFESLLLARCFASLGIPQNHSDSQNLQTSADPEAISHKFANHEFAINLLKILRPPFIQGLKTTQIAEIAPQIAAQILPYIQTQNLDPKNVVMAAIQITAAITSIMQANPEAEKFEEALQQLHKIYDIPPDLTLSCHEIQSTDIPPAFQIWLQNPNAPIPPNDPHHTLLLNALRRRQSDDHEWFAAWLRNAPDTLAWDTHTQIFEIFWRIEAWNDAQSTEHALELLHQTLANTTPSLPFWLQMARLSIQTQRYGEAEHALEQAQHAQVPNIPPIHAQIRQNLIQSLAQKLAAAALSHAQHAREIEEPLLELAMRYGNPQTTAEAALCVFDAQLRNDHPMIQALVQNTDARMRFIEILIERRDTDHLDPLYTLCTKLQKELPQAPECTLLEAASQLDNPHVATQTLAQARRKLPSTHPLYWCAIDLWIELTTAQGALDEAIFGIVDALTSPHPRATRALMFLMARMPKSALPMMQTIMIENIGKEAAIQAFERIKQGNAAQSPESPPPHTQLPNTLEQSLWLLPFTCQIQYHAARLNPPPTLEEQAKAARKESILLARGLKQKRTDPAPEPAQWVHQNLHKASDAFEI